MTDDKILESGMAFGPYSPGCCFYIEKSQTYLKIKNGVKIAEFLLLVPDEKPLIWIVEAKSSSPRPETQPSFDSFLQDIADKLSNALGLYIATYLKRHHRTCSELPISFQNLDLEKTDFRLILIIKNHQEDWLPPLQDALRKKLKPIVRVWDLGPTSVVVLNDDLAKDKFLIADAVDID